MSRVELIVLGILNIRAMHGYDIVQFVEHIPIVRFWSRVKAPSIYKALPRLEKRGLLSGAQETMGKAPPRTVYSLTPAGRQYLRKLVKAFLEHPEHGNIHFFVALPFIQGMVTREYFIEKIQTQRRAMVQADKAVRQWMRAKMKDTGPKPFFIGIMQGMKERIQRMHLDGLDAMEAQAKRPENGWVFLQGEEE